MRYLLLFSLFATAVGAVVAACGDDPGESDLPYAYPIDATPDGVVPSATDAAINRY